MKKIKEKITLYRTDNKYSKTHKNLTVSDIKFLNELKDECSKIFKSNSNFKAIELNKEDCKKLFFLFEKIKIY